MEKVLLGIIELSEAKRLRNLLELQGIELELVSNPQTCSSGSCGTNVEVYAEEADVPAFKAVVEAERKTLLEGLNHDESLAGEVFDPEKGEAKCPACGTVFQTSLPECPDCGLGFSSGETSGPADCAD